MTAIGTGHWLRSRKFKYGCSAGFAVLGLVLLLRFLLPEGPTSVRLSAGPDATRLHAIATWLGEKAAQHNLGIRLLPNAGSEESLTRFANNTIHQNVAEHDATIRVRLVDGGRTGVAATNIAGQWLVNQSNRIISHIPIVKSIYTSVKQVSDTLFSSSGNAFREAVLVQYPHAGSWTIAFVTGSPSGEVACHLPARQFHLAGRQLGGCAGTNQDQPFNASAPATISRISPVIAAWRALLYDNRRSRSSSPALSVALFIAVIRAPCSEALESSSAL